MKNSQKLISWLSVALAVVVLTVWVSFAQSNNSWEASSIMTNSNRTTRTSASLENRSVEARLSNYRMNSMQNRNANSTNTGRISYSERRAMQNTSSRMRPARTNRTIIVNESTKMQTPNWMFDRDYFMKRKKMNQSSNSNFQTIRYWNTIEQVPVTNFNENWIEYVNLQQRRNGLYLNWLPINAADGSVYYQDPATRRYYRLIQSVQ